MSQKLHALASVLAKPEGVPVALGDEVIEVSAPVSTAAAVYEKIRNTLEYQEEHLLRRNAIARYFTRHLGDEGDLALLASDILREMVWAKYLPNKTIPTHLADLVGSVIAKYDALIKTAEQLPHGRRERSTRWILDALATETEYTISPPRHDEALTSYMYEEMRGRIEWDEAYSFSDEEKDLAVFIAVHRALLKSNAPTLGYKVLSLYYPDWQGASTPERITAIAGRLEETIAMIEAQIASPLVERLSRLLRRRAGVFRLLRDVLEHHGEHIEALFESPDELDHEVKHMLEERTVRFRRRLRRTVVRTVLFLFITKMLLALILEVPYDLLFTHDTPRYPLLVNVFFPPLFLTLLALTIHIPEKRNAEDYCAAIRALVVHADHPVLNLRLRRETRNAWSTIFSIVYAALFVVVFGAIGILLNRLGFHALSIALFLFFLSLVAFFGIRIRSSMRDIVASEGRAGLLGAAFDVLMLPIVRAGQWLSTKVSKINVFIFFFDFIVEAPFKVAIRFVEHWLTFVREKKEEI